MQKHSPTLTHLATHAAWWSALEIAARYGTQLVVTMVLARLLSPGDFGLMAMLLVFTTIASVLAEGGLGGALVQKQVTTDDDETSVFLVNLGMSCFLAVVLWVFAPQIARFYSQPLLTDLLEVLLWVLPLGALSAVPNAVLSKKLDFRTRTVAELLASLCSAALALWLAWRGHGVWSLVWQVVVGAGLRSAFLWLLSGWRPRGHFDSLAFSTLFRFGGFLLLANMLNLVSTRLQSLLIGRLFNARSLGYYAMAQDTQQVPAQFMTSLLNRVGLPMFSAVAAQPQKLGGALRLSLRLSMFLFAPCMVGLAAISSPVIVFLYGPAWAPSAPLLSVLALAAVFWPLHVLNLAALSAIGKSELVLKLEVAKALISIPIVIVASPYGVMAVAWSVLISNLACIFINTWWSEKLLGFGLLAQMREVLPPILLAFLSAFIARQVLQLTENIGAGLVMSVVAAAVTYLIGATTFRLRAVGDAVDFVKTLRGQHILPSDGEP